MWNREFLRAVAQAFQQQGRLSLHESRYLSPTDRLHSSALIDEIGKIECSCPRFIWFIRDFRERRL
jgi:hypothetical protein